MIDLSFAHGWLETSGSKALPLQDYLQYFNIMLASCIAAGSAVLWNRSYKLFFFDANSTGSIPIRALARCTRDRPLGFQSRRFLYCGAFIEL